jgi:putative ABC transport system permease protein
MVKHFFIVTLRTFRKQKGVTAINLLGLAIGLACAVILGLFIHFEWSFDRYHSRADRLYRVIANQEGGWIDHQSHTSRQIKEIVKEELAEVETAFRFREYSPKYVQVSVDERKFLEEEVVVADAAIWQALDFQFIHGNPENALDDIYSVVLTRSTALKFFGTTNVLGKMVDIHAEEASQPFQVTGVIEDQPANSHFQFDLMVPFAAYTFLDQAPWSRNDFSWNNLTIETYLMTYEPIEKEVFDKKLSQLVPPNKDGSLNYEMYAQPLTDIRLGRMELGVEPETDIRILYIFSCIAILILLIACINFINLSTARASIRQQEVGIRKVLGATRHQLFRQFLGEAFLYTFVATFLSLVIADLTLPFLNEGMSLEIRLSPLFTPGGIAILSGILGAVVLLAGSYPAIYLSGLQSPLLGQSRGGSGKGGNHLREGLVVIQFTASIILLTGTLVSYQQMDFIRTKALGFDKENVLYLPLHGPGTQIEADVLREEMARLPQVKYAAKTSMALGDAANMHGVSLSGKEDDFEIMTILGVDPFLQKTMDFTMESGNWFREGNTADAATGFVVNEAAVRHFNLENPIGTSLSRNNQKGQVIGVVKDFHTASLHEKIEPLVLFMDTSEFKKYTYTNLAIRLEPGNLRESLEEVEATWTALYPNHPFQYEFQDEKLSKIYEADQRFGLLITLFSLLAVGIACLGLLGLVTFTAFQRTKEIGIRKILGATVKDIILLLTRSYFALIVVSFLVSVPAAWWLTRLWLQDFAYRIEVQPWVFGVVACVTLLITALTTGYQSYRAATANPADILRDE